MGFIPRPSKWKYYLMFTVVNTIGRMPLGWRYGISRIVSDRIYAWRPSIRNNLRSNIRHVLGRPRPKRKSTASAGSARATPDATTRMSIGMHRIDVYRFLENELLLEGIEYVREAQAAGRGVVLASAHYANPEFAVQGLAAAGIQVFALVEPLQPPELGRLMRSLRAVHGHEYQAVSFGAIKNAIAWLRGGGVVAILVDRDIQRRGVEYRLLRLPGKVPYRCGGPGDAHRRRADPRLGAAHRRLQGTGDDRPADAAPGDRQRRRGSAHQQCQAARVARAASEAGSWPVERRRQQSGRTTSSPQGLLRPSLPRPRTIAGPSDPTGSLASYR